jgi:putative copper resistance protein D
VSTGSALDEISRFAIYLGLMLSFGLPLFMVWASRGARLPQPVVRRTSILLCMTVAVAALASVSSLWAMAQSMSGSANPALVWSTASVLLTKTAFGTSWLARMTFMLFALVVAIQRRLRFGLRASTVSGFAAFALLTLPWAGHGAMGSGGVGALHLMLDMGHLLVAGAWLGAITGLAVVATTDSPTAMTAAGLPLLSSAAVRFANVGGILVSVLAFTGIANAIIVMGPHLPRLSTGGYAEVLLAKVTVFGGMLAVAGLNRYRLVPRVSAAAVAAAAPAGTAKAVRALRRSLLVEACLATGILILVSLLGTLDPAA